jgi:hypothetical protein
MHLLENHISRKRLFVTLTLLAVARVLFIWLMPGVHSKDLHAWLHVIDVLNAGGNPYRDTGVLNWPPFWMQVLFVLGRLSAYTSVSAIHLIQATLIVAEMATVLIAFKLTEKFYRSPVPMGVFLAAIALNPISIFLSCQHCNFDVFAGMWILLFAYALMSYHREKQTEQWLAACFFLGMGILTKTVPFILSPLLLAGIQRQRLFSKLLGSTLVIMPVLIGMSVIYALAPYGVKEHVLGYRSMAGWYGITGMCNVLGIGQVNDLYNSASPFMLLGIMGFTALKVHKAEAQSPTQLLTLMLLLLVFLPTFGPGYSPPYILWFLPLLPVYYLATSTGMKKLMASGFFIVALTYMVEYALFESHGSFIAAFFPSENVFSFSRNIGLSHNQSLIRLPMFLVYMAFYVYLLRSYKSAG